MEVGEEARKADTPDRGNRQPPDPESAKGYSNPLFGEGTSKGGKERGNATTTSRCAREADCKRHALPGVTRIWGLFFLFSSNSKHGGSFYTTPFTGFLWPVLHEEEGGTKHSTGEFMAAYCAWNRRIWKLG